MDILVRRADLDSVLLLQEIAKTTFLEAFGATNSAESTSKYLDEKMSEDQLRRELLNPESQFYLAVYGDEVVGYLKLNTGSAQTEPQPNALEIERIYVRQSFHGKAVGQALYDVAFELAQSMGADYVWLGVWAENPRAIRFYEKNGFVPFGEHTFMFGDEAQTDMMMKKPVAPRP